MIIEDRRCKRPLRSTRKTDCMKLTNFSAGRGETEQTRKTSRISTLIRQVNIRQPATGRTPHHDESTSFMATAPTVVNQTARAPDNVIFFDQAVWVDEGTRWTPGFLKRIHLTGIQEAAAWRLLPFEVHILHNLRGRRMHGLGIGAFTPAICGTSGAAAKSKMFELASIGPIAFAAAAQVSQSVRCRASTMSPFSFERPKHASRFSVLIPQASAKLASSASSAAEKNKPLVKIRKLGDKDRQEVTSAFPVISKWHASHGQRHLKWLPHVRLASV